MCGRYNRKPAAKLIYEHFGIDPDNEFSDIRLESCFDIPPGSIQPVVHLSSLGERLLTPMRWGFKLKIQERLRLVFNTKSETVLDSALWRVPLTQGRCIIPASSYIEGRKGSKLEVNARGRDLFGFAGVCGLWPDPETGIPEMVFSIFTTEPNAKMEPIHDRQPVILQPSDYEKWLLPSERPPLHLLRIFPEEEMEITAIDLRQPSLFE